MHSLIQFIMGPMVWISIVICVIGIVVRMVLLIREAGQKEPFLFTYFSVRYGLRSIIAWLIPFYAKSTHSNPIFYGVSYLFHLLLFLVPVFLLAHVVLLEEAFGWTWITLNESLADGLTMVVLLALIFFGVRRVMVREVKFLTGKSDFIYLILVALPFITGVIAYHQIFYYQWMVIAHVISAQVLLILIPFTRFFHMVLAPVTRAYTGSEFGAVRHARDW